MTTVCLKNLFVINPASSYNFFNKKQPDVYFLGGTNPVWVSSQSSEQNNEVNNNNHWKELETQLQVLNGLLQGGRTRNVAASGAQGGPSRYGQVWGYPNYWTSPQNKQFRQLPPYLSQQQQQPRQQQQQQQPQSQSQQQQHQPQQGSLRNLFQTIWCKYIFL